MAQLCGKSKHIAVDRAQQRGKSRDIAQQCGKKRNVAAARKKVDIAQQR